MFHVAGHRLEFGERKTAEAVNVVGTRNVLELVREHAIHRVVVTSTLGVYSDTHGAVVDESHHFTGKHITTYDRIKAKVHYEVALPMMEKGLPAVLLMPGAIYGPRDTSLMADVLTRYLVGRARFVSAGTAYCWAHVEDVARAHLQAMQFGRNGESYIVSGEPHTVREVLDASRTPRRASPPTGSASLVGGVAGGCGDPGREHHRATTASHRRSVARGYRGHLSRIRCQGPG